MQDEIKKLVVNTKEQEIRYWQKAMEKTAELKAMESPGYAHGTSKPAYVLQANERHITRPPIQRLQATLGRPNPKIIATKDGKWQVDVGGSTACTNKGELEKTILDLFRYYNLPIMIMPPDTGTLRDFNKSEVLKKEEPLRSELQPEVGASSSSSPTWEQSDLRMKEAREREKQLQEAKKQEAPTLHKIGNFDEDNTLAEDRRGISLKEQLAEYADEDVDQMMGNAEKRARTGNERDDDTSARPLVFP